MMKASTKFLKDVWVVFLLPLMVIVIAILLFCYWVTSSIYLYGTGDLTLNDDTNLAEIDWDDTVRNIFYFHFFGIFWVVAFIIAFEQFVIASSVSFWYFNEKADKKVESPISRSIWRGFRYHIGSLALGSFLLALIW
eukprot:CAMPEP_0168315214 /NCGR_PEP_ID=MMETSP0210-20121227/10487_1 /TAXON_ID=40633 /ORGANISM="Condylostoma magnum, Strain COL2" /LENGTH=136 /DNA_ID=CAMNT_0008287087 /DNA_START=917 /DNA_END=1324 /DNA_ORIENTATION=+